MLPGRYARKASLTEGTTQAGSGQREYFQWGARHQTFVFGQFMSLPILSQQFVMSPPPGPGETLPLVSLSLEFLANWSFAANQRPRWGLARLITYAIEKKLGKLYMRIM